MGKYKRKSIQLANGSEDEWVWRLIITVSPRKRDWRGYFSLTEKKKDKRKRKTIHLYGGHEESYPWEIIFNPAIKKRKWAGTFALGSSLRKYREQKRASDRYWAGKTFPRSWFQQFEIHHDWDGGETCYFITPEEHHNLHHDIS